MKLLFQIVSFLFFIKSSIYSQKIDDLSFVIDKIKVNYPKYRDLKDKKKFDEFVKITKYKYKDTFEQISKVLSFFDDGHLMLNKYHKRFELPVLYEKELIDAIQYLENGLAKKKYEGYWINDRNNCIIVLINDPLRKEKMIAYTYKALDQNYLKKGAIVFELNTKRKTERIWTKYFDPEFGYSLYTNSNYKNDSILIIGTESKWKKVDKIVNYDLNKKNQFSYEPKLSIIDSNNILLTLPSFDFDQKAFVDSVITANLDLLSKTKNLIIDIRNNLGGNVTVYEKLFPLMYTNSFSLQGCYVYPSKEMIKIQENKIKKIESDSLKKIELEWDLIQMKNNILGNYFSPGELIKMDSISKYPANISIITNYACRSAAELMILDFKQSTKVKIFGEKTAGIVDYLNLSEYQTPLSFYFLYVPTVKRYMKTKKDKIDPFGIKPDVTINENIVDWVKFVVEYEK
jgi:hypothetical protein